MLMAEVELAADDVDDVDNTAFMLTSVEVVDLCRLVSSAGEPFGTVEVAGALPTGVKVEDAAENALGVRDTSSPSAPRRTSFPSHALPAVCACVRKRECVTSQLELCVCAGINTGMNFNLWG